MVIRMRVESRINALRLVALAEVLRQDLPLQVGPTDVLQVVHVNRRVKMRVVLAAIVVGMIGSQVLALMSLNWLVLDGVVVNTPHILFDRVGFSASSACPLLCALSY